MLPIICDKVYIDQWREPTLYVTSMFFSNFYSVLQEKLEEPVSSPPSPLDINNGDTPANLTQHIENLRKEVLRLRGLLSASQNERKFSTSLLRPVHI